MPRPNSSAHLTVDGLSKSFGAHRVLTNISFTVSAGERLALIGENGTGKSTLLRLIAGALPADAGGCAVTVPGGGSARIGLLHQEPPFSPRDTVAEALAAAVAPTIASIAAVDRAAEGLSASPDDATAAAAYVEALDVADRLDAWNLDTRVEQMLAALGLARIPRGRRTGEISGGQRSRLSLAWLLLNRPDVLLLDEPTNHLDDDSVESLTRMLSDWREPLLFASHDRAFLDEVATGLIDLDPAPAVHAETRGLVQDGSGAGIGTTSFGGGYSEYLEARREARRRWEQQYRDEQAELSRLRAGVRESHVVGHADWKPRTEVKMAQKFYADRNAKVVSRRVNDARSRLERLEAEQLRKPPAELEFAGIRAASRGTAAADAGPLLALSEVALPPRLAPTSLTLSAGGKLLVTGANGAGKSTLLSVVSGGLDAESGDVRLRAGARIGFLEQESSFVDPRGRGDDRSAGETYADCVGRELAAAVPLSSFGLLAPRDEQRPLAALSVGQRRRLALAVVLADPPDLLLLDEPTNHLSLALAEALESAVQEYPGAVIVASHDRWLRRRWRGETLHLHGPGLS